MYNALTALHIDKGRYVREYSEIMIVFNLISAIATLVGGFIVVQLFLSMSALSLISFLGVLVTPRDLI